MPRQSKPLRSVAMSVVITTALALPMMSVVQAGEGTPAANTKHHRHAVYTGYYDATLNARDPQTPAAGAKYHVRALYNGLYGYAPSPSDPYIPDMMQEIDLWTMPGSPEPDYLGANGG